MLYNKDKIYRVKVIDNEHTHFNKVVKVIFTGLVFRSLNDKNKVLFIDQIEVIEEVE